MRETWDVAIVGGGPSGSTAATLLKKYAPHLRVLVLERETFPRDHIGESQLPEIGRVLHEMGCWDRVEAAGFPIKIGATYKWGATRDLWDFNFVPPAEFRPEARPARYEGLRQETAFQVDRSVYDEILLDHAAACGAEIRQNTKVTRVHRDGDRITGLATSDGREIEARWFLDGSGNAAVLRRALEVPVEEPTILQNIAIWDYWRNVAWAREIGVGGTRIQVMSLGYGWIWFIPMGPDRTSVGLVLPAETYKTSGKRPREWYEEALRNEPRIAWLLEGAESEGKLASTKDWSFVAERAAGENWFLLGESLGFADPILSAGMTLAHSSAREAAYTILSIERGEHDPEFLRTRYSEVQTKRVRQHMRFAEFWYASNGIFTDLQGYCSEIAATSGLTLDANEAFRWLSTGGFTNETYGSAGLGFFSLEAVKQFAQRATQTKAEWEIGRNNVFRVNAKGARKTQVAAFEDGRIFLDDAIARGDKELPLAGLYGVVVKTLHTRSDIVAIAQGFIEHFRAEPWLPDLDDSVRYAFHTLEAMIAEGWVDASLDRSKPGLRFYTADDTLCMHGHLPDHPLETRALATA